MRLRTFWSPLPNWAYGTIPAMIAAMIAALIWGGDDPLYVGVIGAVAGYFGGGLLWAVLGVIGGDVLEVDFDLQEDVGRVRQSVLWIELAQWRWQFELYDVETISLTHHKSRPWLLQFSGAHSAFLRFADGRELRIGRVPTEQEALDIGSQVSDFIGVELERAPLERRRR